MNEKISKAAKSIVEAGVYVCVVMVALVVLGVLSRIASLFFLLGWKAAS